MCAKKIDGNDGVRRAEVSKFLMSGHLIGKDLIVTICVCAHVHMYVHLYGCMRIQYYQYIN